MNQQSSSDINLKENLQRLSNLMAFKDGTKDQKLESKKIALKKTIFLNLRSFQKPSQIKSLQKSEKEKIIPETTTTQCQTPTTLTQPQINRPQSLNIFKFKDSLSKQKESLVKSVRPKQSETSIKLEKSHFKDWVGLTVIDRNELFLKKKQSKLSILKEQKEQQVLGQCTFTPKLSQYIKFQNTQSQIISKSYLDLFRLKQSNSEKLY